MSSGVQEQMSRVAATQPLACKSHLPDRKRETRACARGWLARLVSVQACTPMMRARAQLANGSRTTHLRLSRSAKPAVSWTTEQAEGAHVDDAAQAPEHRERQYGVAECEGGVGGRDGDHDDDHRIQRVHAVHHETCHDLAHLRHSIDWACTSVSSAWPMTRFVSMAAPAHACACCLRRTVNPSNATVVSTSPSGFQQ